mmetsp:Transcript_8236/g.24269  ORF Transcript_8236/g.24269 Transcript_8236/m.24269 type:complete len:514 (-) Transcript_8236:128-1669(-)
MSSLCQRRRGPTAAGFLRILVPLAAAGHLAAASDDAHAGSQAGHLSLGLIRRAAEKARAARLLLRQAAGQHSATGQRSRTDPVLLVPLPNDTISEDYWAEVNRAINSAAARTPRPATLNDPLATPTPDPWRRIFQASQHVQVLDTPQARDRLNNWEAATPQPFMLHGVDVEGSLTRSMGVVPYDMEIGAHIMHSLSVSNTETPPPTQDFVDAAFISQCPMVMFSSSLRVRPPRCGNTLGDWSDPATNRPILRWGSNRKGGLYMGVDSAVSGEGSVKFAEYMERFTLKKFNFELRNCMDVVRYVVEEQIVKVNHMAPHARSTMLEHDISASGKAFFYRYSINDPNGTTVAATQLYRLDQNEVNFTLIGRDMIAGQTFASARRQGFWRREEWRECTGGDRGWVLDFPTDTSQFETVATVQDLRVVAAATITLMAYRDEDISSDGFQHTGQGHMYWTLAKAILLVFVILTVFCMCSILITKRQVDKKLKRVCFKLETVLLPKRPIQERRPVLHPTY